MPIIRGFGKLTTCTESSTLKCMSLSEQGRREEQREGVKEELSYSDFEIHVTFYGNGMCYVSITMCRRKQNAHLQRLQNTCSKHDHTNQPIFQLQEWQALPPWKGPGALHKESLLSDLPHIEQQCFLSHTLHTTAEAVMTSKRFPSEQTHDYHFPRFNLRSHQG